MKKAGIIVDQKGKVVIAQWPNWPLWLAIGFYLSRFLSAETLVISEWGTALALLYWSYLELFFGVNGWRRALGLLVGASAITNLARLIG